jgi:2-haloacid dehalogenase
MAAKTVIVFDLVGTLVDLSALDPIFRQEFGASAVRREWFTEALQLAFAITARGEFESFSAVTEAALKIVEQRHEPGRSLFRRRRVLQQLKALPPFPDVKPALHELRATGALLAVLTNSGKRSAIETLESGGLMSFFSQVLSAEDAGHLKPAPEPYRLAAKRLKIKPKQLLLVAAHSWDVAGAAGAGCQTCFIKRPGQFLDALTPKPDLILNDLRDLPARLGLVRNAA